eukprot:gene10801-11955_t
MQGDRQQQQQGYAVLKEPRAFHQQNEDPRRFGLRPVSTTCCYCQSRITTNTQFVEGALTYMLVAGICMTGLVCGCCLLPFYWDNCKDLIHSCPVCGASLGYYNRVCPTTGGQ